MKSFKQHLDERCWPGYKSVPGKKAYSPGSCVKENVHDDIKRIRQGKPLKKEEVEYINEASFTSATSMYAATRKQSGNKTEQPTHNIRVGDTVKTKDNKKGSVVFVNGDEVHVKGTNSYYPNAIQHHSSSDLKKEEIELDEGEAWTRKEGQSESGGLNRKGIESYRRANPGSKLSMAVTTKPSKLDPDSKAAKRRKSFCARMGGMKKRLTSAKTANDPDSRINKSLRKWNC